MEESEQDSEDLLSSDKDTEDEEEQEGDVQERFDSDEEVGERTNNVSDMAKMPGRDAPRRTGKENEQQQRSFLEQSSGGAGNRFPGRFSTGQSTGSQGPAHQVAASRTADPGFNRTHNGSQGHSTGHGRAGR